MFIIHLKNKWKIFTGKNEVLNWVSHNVYKNYCNGSFSLLGRQILYFWWAFKYYFITIDLITHLQSYDAFSAHFPIIPETVYATTLKRYFSLLIIDILSMKPIGGLCLTASIFAPFHAIIVGYLFAKNLLFHTIFDCFLPHLVIGVWRKISTVHVHHFTQNESHDFLYCYLHFTED